MNKLLLLLLAVSFFFSCNRTKKEDSTQQTSAKITYANGFSIDYADDYTLITVRNPWDTTRVLHRYVLIDRDKPRPQQLPEGDVVPTPVNSIACLSSADAAVIDRLGDLDKVKAMAETRYVKMPALRKGLEEGAIADIGGYASLNIEQLMSVSPDIIIVAPYQNMGYGKLESTGISIVECASYMENTPLGRAEWIRFIAAFLKKDKEAEEIIAAVAKEYLAMKEKAGQTTSRPTVFSEKMYGTVWYVPGGKSYMAHFFEDAGADYLWRDDEHTGSLTLNLEMVYDKAENADYWIIKSDKDITYDQLKGENESYSWFDAWKNRRIVFSNTVLNNYYEEGVLNPHWVLADLIRIFHPEIPQTDNTPRYFDRMKE